MKYYLMFILFISSNCVNQKNIIYNSPIQCKYDDNTIFVFHKMANFLNENMPEYETKWNKKFNVGENGQLYGFGVFDLTDTTQSAPSLNGCMKIQENHVYHFYALRIDFSYSHILINSNDGLKFFKYVDCPLKNGDSSNKVIEYLSSTDFELHYRVKNCRKYGDYMRICAQSDEPKCVDTSNSE